MLSKDEENSKKPHPPDVGILVKMFRNTPVRIKKNLREMQLKQ